MRILKHRFFGFYLGFILILAMTIGGSAIAAFADSGTGTAVLTGGTLTESGNFSGATASTTLNGTDQTPSYPLPVTVTDATGSGAGWNLTISGADLSDGSTPPHTLVERVSAATAACVPGNGCTNATSTTPSYISGDHWRHCSEKFRCRRELRPGHHTGHDYDTGCRSR